MKQKEAVRIGYNRFIFPLEYSCEGRGENCYNSKKQKQKQSRGNSFVCDRVYLIFLLQHYQILKLVTYKELHKHRHVTDIRGRIYNSIAGGVLCYTSNLPIPIE